MRLTDKVAVITGAASGIGRACVIRFMQEGAQVVATDINANALDEMAVKFDKLQTVSGDVSQRTDAEKIIEETLIRYGKLDILVNSAGITPRSLPESADLEERWDTVIRVNVKGTMLMCHAAVDAMRKHGGGSIVNLGSIMSACGYPNTLPFSDGFAPYPTSKGAVAQLTRDMAVRLAKENIRVNAVGPGFVYSSLTESAVKNDKVHETMKALHPMGRLGEPEEIANVIAFLASDEASFVTGALWMADGGYTAQ